jgi:hypothetical protein
MTDASTFAPVPHPDEIAAFRATDWRGQALAGAWGAATTRRLGAVMSRFRRVQLGLSASENSVFLHWWKTMSSAEKIAAFGVLGGPAYG